MKLYFRIKKLGQILNNFKLKMFLRDNAASNYTETKTFKHTINKTKENFNMEHLKSQANIITMSQIPF